MAESSATPPPKDYTEIAPKPPEGDFELAYFGAQWSEIEIEIGFGRGMFLIQRAERVPGHLVLGFEVKKKWAFLVDERCKKRGLTGAKPMFADAREVLPRIKTSGQVARMFMHFPDPWWKKRHGKRRLVGAELLDEAARLLRPGGEFFVQTDVEERALVHVEAVREHPEFELEGDGRLTADNPYGAVSNREKRAVEDGLPIYRVVARRK